MRAIDLKLYTYNNTYFIDISVIFVSQNDKNCSNYNNVRMTCLSAHRHIFTLILSQLLNLRSKFTLKFKDNLRLNRR